MARLDKFTRFLRDVNKAYKKGIVCPVKNTFYKQKNQREFGCALTAAYMVNGNTVEQNENAVDAEEITNWAMSHYGFNSLDIEEIIEAYDSTKEDIQETREEVKQSEHVSLTKATEVGFRLHEKHEPKTWCEIRTSKVV